MPTAEECTRNLDIEIPAGEVERELSRIAQNLQRRAKIAGFRPGKAPLSLIRQRFQGQIREELLQTLVPAHLRAAFEREQMEPVSTPTIADVHFLAGEPIRFKATFEVLPEFELGDYRSIRTELVQPVVGEVDIDEVVDHLRERYATFEPVTGEGERPPVAAVGMRAAVRMQRQADAAAKPEAAAPAPQQLHIDIGAADTLPAFSEALVGMSPGETRDFEVAYPADYPNSSLAGQAVAYSVTLDGLENKQLPQLSAEFIKERTGLDDEAALRARIRADLLEERGQKLRAEAEERVLDQLIAQNSFPLPAALVDKQVEVNLERRLRTLAAQGVDPRKLKLDWQRLRAANAAAAERQVKAALILERIGKQENLDAPEASVEAEISEIAREARQTPEATRRRLMENGGMESIRSRIRNARVLAFLLAQATNTPFESPATGAESGARGES